MKTNQLVLVVEQQRDEQVLRDSFSDQDEIDLLLEAISQKEKNPLEIVHRFRQNRAREEEEFGDTVEALLLRPFLNMEIREHGINWFRSRIRMEEFRKTEENARKILTSYAFVLFQSNPELKDFTLQGRVAAVQVCVVDLALAEAEKEKRTG